MYAFCEKEQNQQRKQARARRQGGIEQQSCQSQWQHTPTKIIPDFVPGKAPQGIAAHTLRRVNPGQQPGEQLPVATGPAMQPLEPARPGGRIPVIQAQGTIRGATGQFTFQQVMAQHRVRENPALGSVQQCFGHIGPFALKASLAA